MGRPRVIFDRLVSDWVIKTLDVFLKDGRFLIWPVGRIKKMGY
jgi:hypothetical protein